MANAAVDDRRNAERRAPRALAILLTFFLACGSAAPAVAADGAARRASTDVPEPATPPIVGAQCVGADLVDALRASDAANFEKFETSARAVLNGQGLLWRVDAPGVKPSYLFGAMHSSEAIAKSFDELVLRALRRARVVATELPGASTRRVAAELSRLVASRAFRPGGDSLGTLTEDVRGRVEGRLARIGIPPRIADQLQPWYLALALSRANCGRGGAGADAETADARIERLASEQGAAIVALETPVEQVEALASIPDPTALRMIRESTEKGLKPEDVDRTIAGLYSTRRIGYLLAMRGPIWAEAFDVDSYADFISAFITRRNAAMLQRALPIFAAGEAFVAVGALHLPGEDGLVEQVRRNGYSVTRVW